MRDYSGWEIAAIVLIPLAGFAIVMAALAYEAGKSRQEIAEGVRRRVRWRLWTLAIVGLVLLVRYIASLFS